MATAMKPLLRPARATSHVPFLSLSPHFISPTPVFSHRFCKLSEFSGHRTVAIVTKASSEKDKIVLSDDDDEGVSLGTMKLPLDTDVSRFETLLFQWANSLCQGATLPLPMPLKVDKIPGGARLGFITIGDGKTEVLVYIDCLVFPATEGSSPIFRALRNGPLKGQSPPGEPRIMRSLLGALKKSVEIARV
ncbi:hypothetical protein HHK36_016842 [Tetracentron sinense]|uniref:DUF7148 domain-containing protein n=1 Tax=Tetracentron sinense TaxID=13715 RepID=A0A834Z181_TETSI|nr:hypothetical protein HHK36_016842 [Tetracentron sinense]